MSSFAIDDTALISSRIAKVFHGLESHGGFSLQIIYNVINVYKHVLQCPFLTLSGSRCSFVERKKKHVSRNSKAE